MKLNELMSISPGFHRSVNIKYDLNRPEKVSGFIPTEKSEEILEHIISSLQGKSNDCASMLIGSYGTGKSHIMTFLGSLMSKEVEPSNFYPVTEKIKNKRTKNLLKNELEIKSPYLVVPILGSSSVNFEQQLLFSLKTVLIDKKIKLNINSSFTSALEFIKMWNDKFPKVYSSLEKLLEDINYGTVDKLKTNLKQFNASALDVFINVYPKLSAGAEFDSFTGDAVDVYRDVSAELIKKGYRGVFVIFDEFNRVLDTSVKSLDTLKTLQDIAELACRSNDNFRINILLASHRTIGQYLNKANDTLTTNEWHKIEGRFKLFDVSNRPWETYDLISRVLQKKDPDTYDIIASKNPQVKEVGQHRRLKDLFDEMPFEEVKNIIVKNCIPLHPITVFLLPRISAKLAQNERTLFTFLADQNESPMTVFLNQDIQKMEYIRPWHIFDYFEQQLRWSKDDEIKSVYIKIINAINSLSQDAHDEQKFLKTVGIYKIAGNKVNLPCTLEMVKYGIGDSRFIKALTSLQRNKLIYVRQATNEIEIIEPTNIDLEKEIESWISKKSLRISPLTYLTKLGFQNYILPHRYNHIYKITRFLTPAYIDVINLKTFIHEGRLTAKYDGCDGVICYLIPENPDEKTKLQQVIQDCNDERVVFAIPKKPIRISDSVMRLIALIDIEKKLKKAKLDQNTKTLINLHIEDISQDIQNKLKQVTIVSPKVGYYWKGNRLNVTNKYDLSLYISEIMSKVYKGYPIINNELINKDKPTTISKRARNKVIDLMLKNAGNIRNHLNSAQESFMFDTLFITTGIFKEKQNSFNFKVERFEKVFREVTNYFKKSKDEFRDFTRLINILSAPPYGLRKGVIPVILTACIVKYSNYITIRNSSNLDCYIHAKLLDKIVKEPDKYFIKLDSWNENIETLVKGVAEIFQVSLPTNIFSGNAYSEIGDKIFRWIASLPKYARETKSVSKSSQIFRRFAKVINHNPKHILTDKLPTALGFEEISKTNVNEFLSIIEKCKNELDDSLNKLLAQIKDILYSYLLPYGSKDESLVSLARNLLDKDKNQLSNIGNSKIANFIKGYNSYDEDRFAYGFSKIVMKIRPEDWLDDTLEEFTTTLKQQRCQEKTLSPSSVENSSYVKLQFHNSLNNSREIAIYESEVSDLGGLLQAHIESAIENFGDAVSPIEKRQILINIIKKLI